MPSLVVVAYHCLLNTAGTSLFYPFLIHRMERAPTPTIDKQKIDDAADAAKMTIARESATTGDYLTKLGVIATPKNPEGYGVPNTVINADVAAHIEGLTVAEWREFSKVLGKEQKEGKKLAKGKENLKLDVSKEGTGVLGTARLNEGEGSVLLNTQIVTDFQTIAGKETYTNVTAHELSHALDQDAIGTVYAGNTTVTTFDLVEDKSERAGAQALGKGKNYRRPGQPPEYARAQENAEKVRSIGVKEMEMDEAIKEGDTEALQRRILEAGIESGQFTLESLGEQLQTNPDPMFQKAATTVLFEQLLAKQQKDAGPQLAMAT